MSKNASGDLTPPRKGSPRRSSPRGGSLPGRRTPRHHHHQDPDTDPYLDQEPSVDPTQYSSGGESPYGPRTPVFHVEWDRPETPEACGARAVPAAAACGVEEEAEDHALTDSQRHSTDPNGPAAHPLPDRSAFSTQFSSAIASQASLAVADVDEETDDAFENRTKTVALVCLACLCLIVLVIMALSMATAGSGCGALSGLRESQGDCDDGKEVTVTVVVEKKYDPKPAPDLALGLGLILGVVVVAALLGAALYIPCWVKSLRASFEQTTMQILCLDQGMRFLHRHRIINDDMSEEDQIEHDYQIHKMHLCVNALLSAMSPEDILKSRRAVEKLRDTAYAHMKGSSEGRVKRTLKVILTVARVQIMGDHISLSIRVLTVVLALVTLGFGAIGCVLTACSLVNICIWHMPDPRDDYLWTEYSWQVINIVFTALATFRAPQRTLLLYRVAIHDYKIRIAGEHVERSMLCPGVLLPWTQVMKTAVMRMINIVATYAGCFFLWAWLPRCMQENEFDQTDCVTRPPWGVPMCMVLSVGSDVAAGVYLARKMGTCEYLACDMVVCETEEEVENYDPIIPEACQSPRVRRVRRRSGLNSATTLQGGERSETDVVRDTRQQTGVSVQDSVHLDELSSEGDGEAEEEQREPTRSWMRSQSKAMLQSHATWTARVVASSVNRSQDSGTRSGIVGRATASSGIVPGIGRSISGQSGPIDLRSSSRMSSELPDQSVASGRSNHPYGDNSGSQTGRRRKYDEQYAS